MSFRVTRVQEVMRRELGSILSKDYEYKGSIVMVNHISMTPDLRQCHVYISITGDEQRKKLVFEFLTKKSKQIQNKISKRVILKNTPHVIFKMDKPIDESLKVVNLIDDLDIPDLPDEDSDEDLDQIDNEEKDF